MTDLNKKTGTVSVAVTSLLTVIFSCATVLLLGGGMLSALVTLPVAAACLAYALSASGIPFVILLPFVSVAVSPKEAVTAAVAASVIALVGAVLGLVIKNGTDSFTFFIGGSTLYFVIFGAAFVSLLALYFGSIKAGLEGFGDAFVRMVKGYAELYAEELEKAEIDISSLKIEEKMVIGVMPSVIFVSVMPVMWLTKWTLGVIFRLAGRRDLYREATRAPRLLAGLYIFLSIFGTLLFANSEAAYYAVTNLVTVLSVIFMAEGIREFITSLRRMPAVKRAVVSAVIVGICLYFWTVILMAASYFGAYRILFGKNTKRREKKI